ncbi:unnamed protein product [Diatraea saccharalis]|uniref:Uncharacterized protein n=1 Tax=Diatraea saccharalis TaxID=40085 RepID=A0A9N9RDS0_9NEOP|nr:unnamed protein product [Diatraea saccharalis]
MGKSIFFFMAFWTWGYDWEGYDKDRRLRNLAGISIDKLPLSVATLLNRRTLITSANYLEPWLTRAKDLRIWALGRAGQHRTPYRYRVWRVRRLLPKSNNPEHQHGSTGEHNPRHDITIIHSFDQIYLYGVTERYLYANRGFLPKKHDLVDGDRLWIAGCGYQTLKHIRENFVMKQATVVRDFIVDCSKYLPKWWGKFICMINPFVFSGVQNGMALFGSKGFDDYVYGIGCFEIRYNEERIFVFTDLRYYIDWIHIYANITPGDYYEYAYPKWSIPGGFFYDGSGNQPYMPRWNIWYDMYPLGKRRFEIFFVGVLYFDKALSFWDQGTTTIKFEDTDKEPRTSFFKWEHCLGKSFWFFLQWWAWGYDWEGYDQQRRLRNLAGISIDKLPLSVATILNRRTLITSANYLEPWLTRAKDLRVWALGRAGTYRTPYRYRVWRIRRLLPKSNNPEHQHGPTGEHVPRHDIAIIHTLDQIYVYGITERYMYANRGFIPKKHDLVDGDRLWIAGCGFQSLKHIRENFAMKQKPVLREHIVDCSKYLPKWWGKFICMVNVYHFPGVQNGMALFVSKGHDDFVFGLGCFEIRYNEERIFVFTDLRYYIDWIHIYANITPGDYYEYAYPKWSIPGGFFYDGNGNQPYMPTWNIWHDMYPLGKKSRVRYSIGAPRKVTLECRQNIFEFVMLRMVGSSVVRPVLDCDRWLGVRCLATSTWCTLGNVAAQSIFEPPRLKSDDGRAAEFCLRHARSLAGVGSGPAPRRGDNLNKKTTSPSWTWARGLWPAVSSRSRHVLWRWGTGAPHLHNPSLTRVSRLCPVLGGGLDSAGSERSDAVDDSPYRGDEPCAGGSARSEENGPSQGQGPVSSLLSKLGLAKDPSKGQRGAGRGGGRGKYPLPVVGKIPEGVSEEKRAQIPHSSSRDPSVESDRPAQSQTMTDRSKRHSRASVNKPEEDIAGSRERSRSRSRSRSPNRRTTRSQTRAQSTAKSPALTDSDEQVGHLPPSTPLTLISDPTEQASKGDTSTPPLNRSLSTSMVALEGTKKVKLVFDIPGATSTMSRVASATSLNKDLSQAPLHKDSSSSQLGSKSSLLGKRAREDSDQGTDSEDSGGSVVTLTEHAHKKQAIDASPPVVPDLYELLHGSEEEEEGMDSFFCRPSTTRTAKPPTEHHSGISAAKRKLVTRSDDDYSDSEGLDDDEILPTEVETTGSSVVEVHSKAMSYIDINDEQRIKSRNLKGTVKKALKESTNSLRKLLTKNLTVSAEEEIRHLRSENVRLGRELDLIRKEIAGLKREGKAGHHPKLRRCLQKTTREKTTSV